MIVSHRHKFIFIKPMKVGGSAVEATIHPHLGEEDTVSTSLSYSQWRDEDEFEIRRRNCPEDIGAHATPHLVRSLVGEKVWTEYFKFSVVRNPWDMVVSAYWFRRSQHNPSSSFDAFVRAGQNPQAAYWYLDKERHIMLDFCIRFERIQQDFDIAMKKMGLPQSTLLRVVNKTRDDNRHYTEYYDEAVRAIVGRRYRRVIEHFGYKFGDEA